jgi:PAS domain S-box-containing protein
MQLANDTAKLANEVGASLKDSTVKLIGGLSTSRAARLKELKVCQGDMTEVYSALNSSVDLICMTDVKGRLVFVNNKFAETYGYSIEELVGAPVSMVGTKIEDKETFELMWATILKSHVWSGTIHNRNRLTGKIVAVESSIVPIHASSNKSPTFFVCVQTVLERRKDDRQY